MCHVSQGCQLSLIIRETPNFGPYLPVSRSESVISGIITKVAISCRLDFLTSEISTILHCLSYCYHGTFPNKFWCATVLEAIMWLNLNCLCAIYVCWNQRAFLAQMTSFVVLYDVIYHFFSINSQYLMTWGFDSSACGSVIFLNVK